MKKVDSSKLLLSVCALVISISVGYYFLHYLPGLQNAKIAKEKAAELYQKRENCAKQSQEHYQNLKKEVSQSTTVLNPSYHYNASLEKCFYSGGTLQGSGISKYIVDISENETVAMYLSEVNGKAFTGNSCGTCMELEEFKAKEKELLEK
jgi:hypothetical protein